MTTETGPCPGNHPEAQAPSFQPLCDICQTNRLIESKIYQLDQRSLEWCREDQRIDQLLFQWADKQNELARGCREPSRCLSNLPSVVGVVEVVGGLVQYRADASPDGHSVCGEQPCANRQDMLLAASTHQELLQIVLDRCQVTERLNKLRLWLFHKQNELASGCRQPAQCSSSRAADCQP